ncbi:MAG: YihY/virulence factor BrkB family protein [Ktedonobacteraceae bacterium]|nr:YihY/virulence factor BrkB family protein [Ktedonobacteraceae bacterium]
MATTAQKQNVSSSSDSKATLVKDVQKDVRPIQTFINKFNNDWVMNFAGIMAYNLMLAIFPIAIALLGIFGVILGGNAALLHSIEAQTKSLPALTQLLTLASTQLSKNAGFLFIVAILTSIFGGSRLFVTLEGILDILYRVRPRPVVRQNVIALIMLLVFIILIPIMVVASAVPSFFNALLTSSTLKSIPVLGNLTNGVGGLIIGGIVSAAFGLILAFILFEVIYFVVPNQKISWRNSWKGALVAAVLLTIFLIAFPFYTTHFLGGYAGQVGLVVILLIFFYYFAVILLLGAEVNAYFSEKVQPLPNDLVTFISTMGGKLNRDIPETESHAHVNTRPTDSADRTHVSDELQHEEKVQTRNQQIQHQIASAARSNGQARDAAKERKKQTQQGSGKLVTIVSAVAGTVLAFLFQMLQLRHHGK